MSDPITARVEVSSADDFTVPESGPRVDVDLVPITHVPDNDNGRQVIGHALQIRVTEQFVGTCESGVDIGVLGHGAISSQPPLEGSQNQGGVM